MAGFIKTVKREENSTRISCGMANNEGKGANVNEPGPDRVDIAERP
jgi:hypothetical protein